MEELSILFSLSLNKKLILLQAPFRPQFWQGLRKWICGILIRGYLLDFELPRLINIFREV